MRHRPLVVAAAADDLGIVGDDVSRVADPTPDDSPAPEDGEVRVRVRDRRVEDQDDGDDTVDDSGHGSDDVGDDH